MTAATPATPPPPGPSSSNPSRPATTRSTLTSARQAIPAYHRLLVKGQLNRGRVVALAVLGAIAVVAAALSGQSDDREGFALFVVADYGISLLVPLAALLLASPMFGSLVEDRLLVYLSLKPTSRWHLAAAAQIAMATSLLPVTIVPIVAACGLSGEWSLVPAAALAAGIGALTYGSWFLWLGLRFGWGLWLGLAYLVGWENLLSRVSDGTARLSIRSYLATIVEWGADRPIDLADRHDVAAIVVPLGLIVAVTVLIVRTLTTRDID